MADRVPLSALWPRIYEVRPRLRAHAAIHRHVFRGQLWYILEDPTSGRHHRLTPGAYLVISLMNGERTLQRIWHEAVSELGDDCPTQDECLHLVAQLHAADALVTDMPPDLTELLDRAGRHRRQRLLVKMKSPLAVRVPLFDPDRFLQVTFPLVRPFLGLPGLLLWLALVAYGVILAAVHWQELTSDIAGQVLAVDNLPLVLLAFVMIKALHELGHGYFVKKWNGEVHEVGIMFLVFLPVPYVDASAASAFTSKWQRAAVGAAGILVELAVAAIAMIVWTEAEDGLVRALAYNAVLVAGISTLLFNGNPLLRFDGYFVLADLAESPNLGPRSNRYVFYLVHRFLFGGRQAQSPATAPSERTLLLFYAFASFAYRMFIMTVIVLFVASQFFIIGVLVAIWAILQTIVWPVAKGVWFLAANPRLDGRRGRAVGVSAGAAAAVVALLFAVPVPHATIVQGVVWVSEDSVIRAQSSGLVVKIFAEPNSPVRIGDPLVLLEDPHLEAQVMAGEAELQTVRSRHATAQAIDRVAVRIVAEEIRLLEDRLANARHHLKGLVVGSPADGIFILPRHRDLPGSFQPKGAPLGYILDPERPVIRVAVEQAHIDLLRLRTFAIEARLAERPDELHRVVAMREVPAASDRLPSLALSTLGGGTISLDPRAAEEGQTLEPVFEMELAAPSLRGITRIGGRAFLRFDHGRESLANQLYRVVRQVFLERLNV